MATTYFFTTATSDLAPGPGQTDFGNDADLSAPGAGSIGSFNVGTGENDVDFFWTETGSPGDEGGSGSQDYTVYLNPETADADLGVTVQLHRVNSSGTVQSSGTTTSEQSMAADRTYSITEDLGTWASGDRLRVNVYCVGNQGHGNATKHFSVGSGESRVDCPWTLAAPAGPPTGTLATMGAGK